MTLLSEPYRLACPDCGSRSFQHTSTHWRCEMCRRRRSEKAVQDANGNWHARRNIEGYKGGQFLPAGMTDPVKPRLRDKKTGKLVNHSEVTP